MRRSRWKVNNNAGFLWKRWRLWGSISNTNFCDKWNIYISSIPQCPKATEIYRIRHKISTSQKEAKRKKTTIFRCGVRELRSHTITRTNKMSIPELPKYLQYKKGIITMQHIHSTKEKKKWQAKDKKKKKIILEKKIPYIAKVKFFKTLLRT